MKNCAVRPVAVAAGRRKVIRPVIMAMDRRSERSKVKGHVGTAIQHSSVWAGTRLHPDLGAPRLGQDLPGPACILMLDCLSTVRLRPCWGRLDHVDRGRPRPAGSVSFKQAK